LRVFDPLNLPHNVDYIECTLFSEFQALLFDGEFFQFRPSFGPAQECFTAARIEDAYARRQAPPESS
jgi:hypothetical protein